MVGRIVRAGGGGSPRLLYYRQTYSERRCANRDSTYIRTLMDSAWASGMAWVASSSGTGPSFLSGAALSTDSGLKV